jgi:WD40 repeat protein
LTLEGHTAPLLGLAVTPDGGKVIAGSEDRRIYIWDLLTDKLERILESHTGWVTGVAVPRDGRFFLSKGHAEGIILWRCQDWRPLSFLKEGRGISYARAAPLFHPLRNDIIATYGEKNHHEVRI